MKRLILVLAVGAIVIAGFTSSFGQTVSDEARRHFDRGAAAVEMAKSPADYEAAIKEFKQAIDLAPDWADAYFNLGKVQEQAEKFADAIASFRQYLRLAPSATDAETVKSLINKLEYKKDQGEGFKKVYEMMASHVRKLVDRKKLSGSQGEIELWHFRMVSGKLHVTNFLLWADVNPQMHPPLEREWEPVKVNGRFYEYTFSYYVNISSAYVVRYDFEVKGEIISIDPPRIKEIVKFSVTWGAPIKGNIRPWSVNDNYGGTSEYIYELVAE